MALVGPATSLLLGAVFHALFRTTRAWHSYDLSFGLYYVAYLNLSLGLFNLVPAFPMDGGRVLRGLLARRMGLARATRIAAGAGTLFAASFAVLGFFSANLLLMLVGFFVYMGAEAEEQQVLARTAFGDMRVREVMTPQVDVVDASETLYDVGERMVHERRLAFPVTEDGRVLGIVTLEALEHVPVEKRRTSLAGEAAKPAPAIDPDDRVVDALGVFDERHVARLPVTHEGRLVGLLSLFDIARGLRLREFDASQHRAPG